MKVAKLAGLIIFILAIPFLLFTSAVRFVVNDFSLYHYGFVKYNIPAATGIELTELDRAAKELIHYFNSGEERINIVLKSGIPLYNEKEVAHLKDVKGLIQFDYHLQLMSLICALGYILVVVLWRRSGWWPAISRLAHSLMYAGGLSLAVMVVIGVAMLVAFDRVFIFFHLIGFSNLLWILDPRTDKLIQMFPEDYFFDAAMVLAGVTLALALVVGIVGWGLHYYSKKRLGSA